MRYLKLEFLVLVVVLGASAIFGLSRAFAKSVAEPAFELIDDDLEPFRTAFNGARDHVRAVLLVGPT